MLKRAKHPSPFPAHRFPPSSCSRLFLTETRFIPIVSSPFLFLFFPYPLSRVIFSYPPVASYIFFIYIFLLFLRQRVQTRLRVRGASFSFTRRDDPCELALVFVEDFIEYKRIWIDDRLLIKIIDLYVFFKYTKFMIL